VSNEAKTIRAEMQRVKFIGYKVSNARRKAMKF
jgi:hypothetical protein